jgi:hypothetical protein
MIANWMNWMTHVTSFPLNLQCIMLRRTAGPRSVGMMLRSSISSTTLSQNSTLQMHQRCWPPDLPFTTDLYRSMPCVSLVLSAALNVLMVCLKARRALDLEVRFVTCWIGGRLPSWQGLAALALTWPDPALSCGQLYPWPRRCQ